MEENYIHIYTSFLSELMQAKKLTFQQTLDLLKFFGRDMERITDRQGLIAHIDRYLFSYPQLNPLKQQLLDETHKFPEPPAASE